MIAPLTPPSSNGSNPTQLDTGPDLLWLNKRFNYLYGLIFVLSLMMLTILVLVIVLMFNMKAAESKYSNSLNDISSQVGEAIQKIKQEHIDILAKIPAAMAPQQQNVPAARGGKITTTTLSREDFGTAPDEEISKAPMQERSWKNEPCTGQCQHKFKNTPLVVLSFDGFGRDYLDRGIMKSLEKFQECGATAERVYPSYPSKTFPNHYTMATGLYPESHGIVDNNIWDPTISGKVESMKKTTYSEFFKGEPIWNALKRQTGRSTNCLFWYGCSYNITGMKPDIAPPYKQDLKFKDRVDMIIGWLLDPNPPALVMGYFDQPDTVGHFQTSEKDVNDKLAELDSLLDYLFSTLHDKNLTHCINLLIVSDHGMQSLSNNVYFEKEVDMEGLIGVSSVVGRIYKNGTDLSIEEISDKFACRKDLRVFTRETNPPRKHYALAKTIGDVLLEGHAGTTFKSTSDFYSLSADHGYDYLLPTMHAVFFARGPNIAQNVVIPAFQNVEYMNLFADLLGLPKAPENNGTMGVLDAVLVKKPARKPEAAVPIPECATSSGVPIVKSCILTKCDQQEMMTRKLKECQLRPKPTPSFQSTGHKCLENYCNLTIIKGTAQDKTVAVVELINSDVPEDGRRCPYVFTKYGEQCPLETNGTFISIGDDFSSVANLQVEWPEGFDTTLARLDAFTRDAVKRFKRLVVVSGTAYDKDLNGVADMVQSGSPSHFYRLLLFCSGPWTADFTSCQNPDHVNIIGCILPILTKDINCLTTNDLLLEYSARLKDVELISGLRFFRKDIPWSTILRLKTHIVHQMW